MRLIGLSGYARSGKDTVGRILVEEHGFARLSFADKLREVLLAMNPWVVTKSGISYHLDHLVKLYGWEECKDRYPDIRHMLQRLGTEGGRRVLGEDVWVNATLRDLDMHGSYVVTDVRFPNEWRAIVGLKGEVWRVERPGTKPVTTHASETALDKHLFHHSIFNDGSLEELRDDVAVALMSKPLQLGLWS